MSQFHPDLIAVARAVNRDTEPEELLADSGIFLNQVMARCELKEVCIAQHHFTKEQFQSAYVKAPPDLYFPPRWEYWGIKLFGVPDYKPPPAGYPKYARTATTPAVPEKEFHPDLIAAAHRVNWYTEAEELLADTDLFLNEVMARGRPKEIQAALNHYSTEQFQSAYEFAPPGLYGPVTWAYWGLMLFGNTKHKPFPIRFPSHPPPPGPGKGWCKLSA